MAGKRGRGGGGGRGHGGKGGDKPAAKKARVEVNYQDGDRGFLVEGASCQEALRGSKDWRLWLEVEAELPPESGAGQASTAAEGLDAELAELRAGGDEEALAARRFVPVGPVCKQVAYVRAQRDEDVPSSLAHRFLRPSATKKFTSRFAEKVFPVDQTSRPKVDDFKAMASEALAPHVGRAWRFCFEHFRGGWNTVSRDEALATCKEVLGSENLSVSDPEISVLCTLNPRFVGLAVLQGIDVEDLRVDYGDRKSVV